MYNKYANFLEPTPSSIFSTNFLACSFIPIIRQKFPGERIYLGLKLKILLLDYHVPGCIENRTGKFVVPDLMLINGFLTKSAESPARTNSTNSWVN